MALRDALIGENVEQVAAEPGYEKFVGRKAAITEAFKDENGNWQCQTDDGVWCPLKFLSLR